MLLSRTAVELFRVACVLAILLLMLTSEKYQDMIEEQTNERDVLMDTATTPEDTELTQSLADLEDSVNHGFSTIALKMGIGSLIEKTGAHMVASSTVSEAGVNIVFDLTFTKVDVKKMSAVEAVDVVLVQEYAKFFGEKFLNR